ncbi:hypothetical protein vseg_003563 [Gypsophila vaccaria]
MKGGVSSYQISTKRRWKGFVIAVLGLVILSMLVPLVFLLGFHNGFHSSGFPSERQGSMSHNKSEHIAEIIERLVPPKDRVHIPVEEMPVQGGLNQTVTKSPLHVEQRQGSLGNPVEYQVRNPSPSPPPHKVNISSPVEILQLPKAFDESEMSCELRFGSYCLWRRENKEVMIDSMVKKMKDRLFVARAYFPSIAKLPAHEKLSRDMKQNIQDFERILSETTTDADLPSHIGEKLQKMEAVIARAKSIPVDCNNVDKKFRQLLDLTEDEANFHTKQSSFLYQLAVQTMPKSLHCLSMRLTVEYFNNASLDLDASSSEKFADPELYHYVVFSSNILASSVLINSTVANAKGSKNLVFHVLTDRENYYSMKLWFLKNTFKDSSVQQDLSALWKINMGRKVNGAVETCALRLGHLSNYLGRNSFNSSSCAWMSGLNVINLARWRELKLSGTFQKLVHEFEMEGTQFEAAASRASLLTFQDLVYTLDDSWVLSGLGHDYGLGFQALRNAAALHYNGNMKPWLELGIPKYKSLWVKFLNREDQYLSECNVSP